MIRARRKSQQPAMALTPHMCPACTAEEGLGKTEKTPLFLWGALDDACERLQCLVCHAVVVWHPDVSLWMLENKR